MSTENMAPEQAQTSAPSADSQVAQPADAFTHPKLQRQKSKAVSRKGVAAATLLVASVLAVSTAGIQRLLASGRPPPTDDNRRDRPAAASAEPRTLDLSASPYPAASGVAVASAIRIPALRPTEEDLGDPIAMRHASPSSAANRGAVMSPQDAPVLLVSSRAAVQSAGGAGDAVASGGVTPGLEDESPAAAGEGPLATTSRNLQTYQRQLQGMLDSLTRTAQLAQGPSPGSSPPTPLIGTPGPAPNPQTSLFGGQLQGSSTLAVVAGLQRGRSLVLPKGTAFTCALKTRVISATSGFVGCLVQRNVFGDDGRVLLIERGSHIDGEYRIASVKPGMVRIPVLWTRIRTPLGVTVDIESPATGPLGESGIDGHVDNRWRERIGAAMLLSLIDDSVKLAMQGQGSDRQGDTIVLPSTAQNTSKLAEKVLDSTINIPPLVYRNQGGIVGIHVARDVDFSSVYELVPTQSDERRP